MALLGGFALTAPPAGAATGPGRVAYTELGAPSAVLALADGGLLVAGSEPPNHDRLGTRKHLIVARLRANGTLDRTFGTRGISRLRVLKGRFAPLQLLLQDDGGIVVAGTRGLDSRGLRLVRLTPSGGLDGRFGEGGVAAAGVARDVHRLR